MVARVGAGIDGLDAGGAVDVDCGWNAGSLFGADAGGEGHERIWLVDLEEFVGAFGEHRGGEGAERFAEFDAGVDHIADAWMNRGGKDRAVAEGARADLVAALEPTDDAAVR